MDEDGLPIVGSGVDLTKVEAIHQKRMLAFLNHFITHTVRFLNKFSCVCEEKLETLNLRMQKLDTTLSILEAKLASIPGLDDVTAATAPSGGSTAPSSQAPATNTPQAAPTLQESQSQTSEEPVAAEPVASDNPVSRDPRYAHYFKMLNVGIPAQAIKLKMQSEGVDPDILDDPNAPAPPKEAGGSDSDFSDDDSQSSFSDD